jgi:hypothetical protein
MYDPFAHTFHADEFINCFCFHFLDCYLEVLTVSDV